MKLKLYVSSQHKPIDVLSNRDSGEVMNLLWVLERKGTTIEVIDTDSLSDEEIQRAYLDAVVPSVYKKFGIRRIFGTRRRSGWLFGKGVPALLVYEERDRYPIDVYPHDEQGVVRTIKDFLQSLLSKEG